MLLPPPPSPPVSRARAAAVIAEVCETRQTSALTHSLLKMKRSSEGDVEKPSIIPDRLYIHVYHEKNDASVIYAVPVSITTPEY